MPPIAAVREGATLPPGALRALPHCRPRSLLTLLGFAALAYGLFGNGLGTTQILLYMGLGTLLIFFGMALLSARFARPLAHVLGWPATKIGGAAGALARDNAQRNPQRTASTASALMIGLALVTLVAVLAAGITKSFKGAVERSLDERLRGHRGEQLLTDSDRGRRRCRRRRPAWRRSRTCAAATRRSSDM